MVVDIFLHALNHAVVCAELPPPSPPPPTHPPTHPTNQPTNQPTQPTNQLLSIGHLPSDRLLLLQLSGTCSYTPSSGPTPIGAPIWLFVYIVSSAVGRRECVLFVVVVQNISAAEIFSVYSSCAARFGSIWRPL